MLYIIVAFGSFVSKIILLSLQVEKSKVAPLVARVFIIVAVSVSMSIQTERL